jgi:tRNA dimethylallyltransferase
MVKQKPKLVAIVGPNASGKSDLGIQLALMFNGEVISADSRQVYKGLNLTSGKLPGTWQRKGRYRYFVYHGVIHYLTDICSPKKRFTVQKFKKKAKRSIGRILDKGKLPIIVGGTGFYVDTLLYDLDIPKVPPNRKLRKELDGLSTEQLINRLSGLDPQRISTIDTKNRRRLIRAIEIVISTGSQIKPLDRKSSYNNLIICIYYPDEVLRDRIRDRLTKRLGAGMVDEIKKLHDKGLSWERLNELGLEFKYITYYLQGQLTLSEMKEQLEKAIWHFAKRQITWFKRDKNIIWIDSPEKAFPIVQDFLSREDEPSPAR